MDKTAKRAYLAVILIQSIYAGMYLVSKEAFNGGMNSFVFIFYRQAFASAVLIPISLFFEWKSAPPLTFVIFCKIFLLSFFGITLSLNISGIALIYTSATLAAATANSIPVMTFFLAVILGIEVLRVRTKVGVAKLIGVTTCMIGVGCLAFFKGPHFRILIWDSQYYQHTLQLQHNLNNPHKHSSSSPATWVKGCFLMLLSNFFWCLWIVFQGRVLKSYPSKLLFTSLQCFLSAVQTFAIAIALERRTSEWKLGFDVRLLAVAYCGIVVTGVTYYLQAWTIEKKGPVFLAMWMPLALVITMFISTIFLGETITLGSILGGGLLIIGLYSVLWAKGKEDKQNTEDQSCCPSEKYPISELKEITISKPSSVA